jgi:hypothetical protein
MNFNSMSSTSSNNQSRNNEYYNFMNNLVQTYASDFLKNRKQDNLRAHLKFFFKLLMNLCAPMRPNNQEISQNDQILTFAMGLNVSLQLEQTMTIWVRTLAKEITFDDLRFGPLGLIVVPSSENFLHLNSTVAINSNPALESLNLSVIPEVINNGMASNVNQLNLNHLNQLAMYCPTANSIDLNKKINESSSSTRQSTSQRSQNSRSQISNLTLPSTNRSLQLAMYCPTANSIDLNKKINKSSSSTSQSTNQSTSQRSQISRSQISNLTLPSTNRSLQSLSCKPHLIATNINASIHQVASNSDENVSNENVSNENVSNENVSNENVSNENVSNENVSNENVSNENVSNENVSNENISNENISNLDISIEYISSGQRSNNILNPSPNNSNTRRLRNNNMRNNNQFKQHQQISKLIANNQLDRDYIPLNLNESYVEDSSNRSFLTVQYSEGGRGACLHPRRSKSHKLQKKAGLDVSQFVISDIAKSRRTRNQVNYLCWFEGYNKYEWVLSEDLVGLTNDARAKVNQKFLADNRFIPLTNASQELENYQLNN